MSTTLFKLITYKIIEQLEKQGVGFVNEVVEIIALFFADDGLLLAETIEDAERNIEILRRVSKEFGLEINNSKSSIVVFNAEGMPESIEGIQIQKSLK